MNLNRLKKIILVLLMGSSHCLIMVADTESIVFDDADQPVRADTVNRQGLLGTLNQILRQLEQCCAQTQADFQATWNALTIDALTSYDLSGVVTAIAPCGPIIPITGPGWITSPGNYCLANNIVGNITIAADDVILDLNNKQISFRNGIALYVDGRKNITIKNGHVKGSSTGAKIYNSTYVRIANVQFTQNNYGGTVEIQNSFDVFISNAYFMQNAAPVISIDTSSNVQVIDTIMRANQAGTKHSSLCFAQNSSGMLFDGCQIINNHLTSSIMYLSNITDSVFRNFHVYGNSYILSVFQISSCQNTVLENLIIEANTAAAYPSVILALRSSGIIVRDCVVSKNTGEPTISAIEFCNVSNGVIERNSINGNTSPGASVGINITQLDSMIIANEVQGASTNYLITGGVIPIMELSQATAAITIKSGGSSQTPYHNLSVVA